MKAVMETSERLVLSSIENDSIREPHAISAPNVSQNVGQLAALLHLADLRDQETSPDLDLMTKVQGLASLNPFCVDCGAAGPDWASTNLGTFICLQCSGVHRSFGTHISQVRSVRLDRWTKELVDGMERMGNTRSIEIWEHNVPSNTARATSSSSRKEREAWMSQKYLEGRFRADYIPPHDALGLGQGHNPLVQFHLITPQLSKCLYSPLTHLTEPKLPKSERMCPRRALTRSRFLPSTPIASLWLIPSSPTAPYLSS